MILKIHDFIYQKFLRDFVVSFQSEEDDKEGIPSLLFLHIMIN